MSTLLDEVGLGQTAQYISHASICNDFKLAVLHGQWSSYAHVAKELELAERRGKIAVRESYRVMWRLVAGVKMAIEIGGERLALELKPNRDGIAVWRLVE